MGLSTANLTALKVFPPSCILDNTLPFFEFLRYETKSLRNESLVSKNDLLDYLSKSTKVKQISKIKKSELSKQFEEFAKNLDRTLFIKNSKDEIGDIKWKPIDNFCSLLRFIERSDERKVRWALYHLFVSGHLKISTKELSSLLQEFKIKNLEKILSKIVKTEKISGFNVEFDGKYFIINHESSDKLIPHYLADAIEEPLRRSPGELEKEILELIDEGSYSNQEISQFLLIDEGLVSRTITKLRDQNKIVLSSFGQRGARYYTTNCENCPFGTTQTSCRKEALSYVISTFATDFGVTLSANDFDTIETNQALLKIKRIMMIARKEKTAKLEQNISENLASLLSKVIDKFIEIESPDKSTVNVPEIKIQIKPDLANLPMLYQLGFKKGAEGGIHLMDEMLHLASKSIKTEDRLKIKKHALKESNKFLKTIGLDEKH